MVLQTLHSDWLVYNSDHVKRHHLFRGGISEAVLADNHYKTGWVQRFSSEGVL